MQLFYIMRQEVILVNEFDCAVGTEEKIKAHEKGLLHRAFSVFIINGKHELLLQKRSSSKYHSPGLWTNTCCSHPVPGEDLQSSAEKRLVEEMGFTCSLSWSFKFIYKTSFENKLTEHELDHVFIGKCNAKPIPNPDEVEDWQWVDIDFLKLDVHNHPDKYTFWLRYVYDRFYLHYEAWEKQNSDE
jgi:isopentenyl-diphosphate delta-isomerase